MFRFLILKLFDTPPFDQLKWFFDNSYFENGSYEIFDDIDKCCFNDR